jgi:uncharacterized membrane protein YbhN (UPF0104 family)
MSILAEINWEMPLLLVLFGCLAVVWLYALVNCLRRDDFNRRERIAWIIVILFTNDLGLIAYFIFCNREKRRLAGRYPKALNPITGIPNNHATLRSHH